MSDRRVAGISIVGADTHPSDSLTKNPHPQTKQKQRTSASSTSCGSTPAAAAFTAGSATTRRARSATTGGAPSWSISPSRGCVNEMVVVSCGWMWSRFGVADQALTLCTSPLMIQPKRYRATRTTRPRTRASPGRCTPPSCTWPYTSKAYHAWPDPPPVPHQLHRPPTFNPQSPINPTHHPQYHHNTQFPQLNQNTPQK